MEAVFTCLDLKPDECNLATTILVHKLFQSHKIFILGKLWLQLLRLEWGQCSVKYILDENVTLTSQRKVQCD